MNRDGASLDAQAESGHPGWPIFRPTKEEPMPASITLPEHHDGAIRVVSETAQMWLCLEGELRPRERAGPRLQINRSLMSGTDLIWDLARPASSTPASSTSSCAPRSRPEQESKPSCFNSAQQPSSSASSKSPTSNKCYPAPMTGRRLCG